MLLGVGTALVYPTLIAAVSDAVTPSERAPVVGVYRFWRDIGLRARRPPRRPGRRRARQRAAIAIVAVLTAASGVWVAATRWSRLEDVRALAPAKAG